MNDLTSKDSQSAVALHPVVGPTRVLMFQPQFSGKVEAGEKHQTIRPARKLPIQVGDKLSLREWTGKPYRSKQRVLRETVCTKTIGVRLDYFDLIEVGGQLLNRNAQQWFAQDDGFENSMAMLTWFAKTHGLPFSGVMIVWPKTLIKPTPVSVY